MICDKPYIQLYVKTVYIDTSALTRRKTLVKMFFASLLISSHVNKLHKETLILPTIKTLTTTRPPGRPY